MTDVQNLLVSNFHHEAHFSLLAMFSDLYLHFVTLQWRHGLCTPVIQVNHAPNLSYNFVQIQVILQLTVSQSVSQSASQSVSQSVELLVGLMNIFLDVLGLTITVLLSHGAPSLVRGWVSQHLTCQADNSFDNIHKFLRSTLHKYTLCARPVVSPRSIQRNIPNLSNLCYKGSLVS